MSYFLPEVRGNKFVLQWQTLQTLNKKIVYLLEDDADMQQMIEIVLSRHDYQLHTFSTVKDFEQQISVRLPDLCILDINLPDGNGMDVSANLSAAPFTSHVPVLLISADPHKPDHLHQTGAWYFLRKPFSMQQLVDAVKKII